MPFPGDGFYFPTKEEAADYLESYARHFEMPIRLATRVNWLVRDGSHLLANCGSRSYSAERIIVATGAYSNPYTPDFAAKLNPSVIQLHSSVYRNTSQLPPGEVLVVGAGNSGAEIAIEAAGAGRRV